MVFWNTGALEHFSAACSRSEREDSMIIRRARSDAVQAAEKCSSRSLSRGPHVVGQRRIETGPKRINIESAASGITRVNRWFDGLAHALDIHEHPLDALFMKVRVMPVRNDVAQQSRMIDGRPDVANVHAAPVRLAGDGTIRFQQIRYNRFIDGRLLGIRAQERCVWLVTLYIEIEPVQRYTAELAKHQLAKTNRRRQLDGHRCPRARGYITFEGVA